MKLLNIGSGFPRIEGDEWVNLDNLHAHLLPGTPERDNLDAETNYVNHDLLSGPMPFSDGAFDGAILLHVLEHFDAQQGLALLVETHRVLKPGGAVLVSVPDASYFRRVHREDRNANWPRLFDVSDPDNPIPTFFEAALWFNEHKAILTEDALWCYMTKAGFGYPFTLFSEGSHVGALQVMIAQLNRRKFSLEMAAVKYPLI